MTSKTTWGALTLEVSLMIQVRHLSYREDDLGAPQI